jgi:hypothetical protein
MHGAHLIRSSLKGTEHPNFKHGKETLEAKTNRSASLVRLRRIEDALISSEFYKINRSKGRKPKGY